MRLLPHTPVLWRGGTAHQVGLARAVTVTAGQARALAHGSVPPTPSTLGIRLAAAGLVAPEGHHRGLPRIRVRGLSTTGVAAAEALARAGARLSLVDSTVEDSRSTGGGILPVVGTGSRAARTARLISSLRPQTLCDLDPTISVDAEVVVAVGTLPAPVHHRLMVDGTPHVAVLCDEAGVTVVGVRAGRSACSRCLDLHRAEHDPAWPLLALQCEPLDPAPPLPSALVAGTMAAALALTLVPEPAPEPNPEPAARRGSAWRVEDGMPRQLNVRAHRDCGCMLPQGSART